MHKLHDIAFVDLSHNIEYRRFVIESSAEVSRLSFAHCEVWFKKKGKGCFSRDAIRLITVEFPGYKPPSYYLDKEQKEACSKEHPIIQRSYYLYLLE